MGQAPCSSERRPDPMGKAAYRGHEEDQKSKWERRRGDRRRRSDRTSKKLATLLQRQGRKSKRSKGKTRA